VGGVLGSFVLIGLVLFFMGVWRKKRENNEGERMVNGRESWFDGPRDYAATTEDRNRETDDTNQVSVVAPHGGGMEHAKLI
jgi:hypothetical protein